MSPITWDELTPVEKLTCFLLEGKVKRIRLCVADPVMEPIGAGTYAQGEFNDLVLEQDGTLELWQNYKYEI